MSLGEMIVELRRMLISHSRVRWLVLLDQNVAESVNLPDARQLEPQLPKPADGQSQRQQLSLESQ